MKSPKFNRIVDKSAQFCPHLQTLNHTNAIRAKLRAESYDKEEKKHKRLKFVSTKLMKMSRSESSAAEDEGQNVKVEEMSSVMEEESGKNLDRVAGHQQKGKTENPGVEDEGEGADTQKMVWWRRWNGRWVQQTKRKSLKNLTDPSMTEWRTNIKKTKIHILPQNPDGSIL